MENSENRPYMLRFLVTSDTIRTESAGSNRQSDQYQIINYLLNRASTAQAEELTPSERRQRRRRFSLAEDESTFSEDDVIREEDYIDFRTYPLTLNWKDIYSVENDSYEILEDHGYIGVFFYNEICKSLKTSFKTRPENFVFNILDYYCKNLNKNANNSDINIKRSGKVIVDIIKSNLNTIKLIIQKGLMLKKEIVLIKVLFDILIHYFTFVETIPYYAFIINELIPINLLFYSNLSDEDITYLNDKISDRKNIRDVLENDLNTFVFNKKRKYIKYLIRLRNDFILLFNGLDYNKFII